MKEEQIRTTLNRAAAGALLPDRFRSPSRLVLNPPPDVPKRAWWLQPLPRTALVAAVVLLAMAGLAITQPGRVVLAEALRQLGWVQIDSRSLEERMGDFKNAKAPPPAPEELERARWIDPTKVAEVRRQHGFVAPLPDGETTLKEERASRPLRLEKDGQYRIVEEVLAYGQTYRLATGQEIGVSQQFIAPPESGSYYEFNGETRETKILGHPAYVTTRHIGWDGKGKTVINEFPFVMVLIEVKGGNRWLQLNVASKEASLEQVMQFAETFTAHAEKTLAAK